MIRSERRPALVDCGCEVTVYADGSGVEIHYCPLHQAAPELLELLRRYVNYQQRGVRELALAAIAKATSTISD